MILGLLFSLTTLPTSTAPAPEALLTGNAPTLYLGVNNPNEITVQNGDTSMNIVYNAPALSGGQSWKNGTYVVRDSQGNALNDLACGVFTNPQGQPKINFFTQAAANPIAIFQNITEPVYCVLEKQYPTAYSFGYWDVATDN
jgi:hypothetical protein